MILSQDEFSTFCQWNLCANSLALYPIKKVGKLSTFPFPEKSLNPDAMKILFTKEEIAARTDEMAVQITQEMPRDLVMAPVLTGAFIFAADLLRAITLNGHDPDVDFVQLSSYGGARSSSGVVTLLKDFSLDLTGKTVLLVDDVLDTGRSLHFAKRMVMDRGAAAVKLAVLVRKNTGRGEDIDAEYVGFEAGADDFLVGYGMDDDGRKRGLDFIGAL